MLYIMNIVIVGDGQWSKNFQRLINLNYKNLNIYAIVDPAESQIKSDVLRVSSIYELDEKLKNIDIAIICSPTVTHYETTKYFLTNKIHCLVEKPLVTKSNEVDELFKIADKNKLALSVDHIYLEHNAIKKIIELVQAKELGEILHMSFSRTNLGPIRTDVNSMWDLATHDISILLALIDLDPISITAKGYTMSNNNIYDMVNISLNYEKLFVTIFSSWLHPSKERIIKIVGTDKMLIFDELNTNETIKIFDKKIGNSNNSSPGNFGSYYSFKVGNVISPYIANAEPLENIFRNFILKVNMNRIDNKLENDRAYKVISLLEKIQQELESK